MKKSILASSIAAAVFGLGAVTGAQAAGDILLVPYFSAQGANATLLSIVNTDTVNGKAVKVRFRGAANSDDLLTSKSSCPQPTCSLPTSAKVLTAALC